jgi:hypothetical protein
MAGFSFRHTHRVSEAQWIAIEAARLRHDGRLHGTAVRVRLGLGALAGAAMLLSPYTFSVGLVALGVVAFVVAVPRMTSAHRGRFARLRQLHGPGEHGADGAGFWFRSDLLEARCAWPNLVSWEEAGGMLCLYGAGMPPVYLPVEALREQGAYAAVRALAAEHGDAVDAASRPRVSPPTAGRSP